MNLQKLDLKLIEFFRRSFIPVARFSVFAVYFWFGLLKLLDLSPATPLASALVDKTIGLQYFDTSYTLLALLECLIGVLFLFPKATRIVIPLLLLHLVTVCSPLLITPELVWSKPFVPTLEGQYIIKNVAIIAVAIGVAAQTPPIKSKKPRP
jgi:uncharacterized membrane protein YkgB